jgi:hypothetical protein
VQDIERATGRKRAASAVKKAPVSKKAKEIWASKHL